MRLADTPEEATWRQEVRDFIANNLPAELKGRGEDGPGEGQIARNRQDETELRRARAGGEWAKILAFALAARDQHERSGEPFERSERRADVRAFRIVDEGDAFALCDVLATVRQPGERAQYVERGVHVRRQRLRERERRQRVRLVVRAA